MRILYIIDGMFNAAGRERVIANKASCLTNLGHQVTIITTNQRNRTSYYPLPKEVDMYDLDINYDDYSGKNMLSKVLAYRAKSKLFSKRLNNYLSEHPQDVLVALMDRYVPAILQWKDLCVTVYENHFNKFAMYDLRESRTRQALQQTVYRMKDWFYTRFYYRRLDIFAVLTEEDKTYWGRSFHNIMCMPNSINYDDTTTAPLNNRIVISVGRLTYQKGYDRLVSIWQQVEPLHPDWQMHIYGSGEDEEALHRQISDAHLHNISIFAPTPDIASKLLSASAYVMTSRFEGLPMVLLEAMSAGLPLVSFDCKCGPKDVIADGTNGYLVPDGNLDLMAQRLDTLLSNEDLRRKMGKTAKEHARNYSHQAIIARWIALFEEKLTLKHAPRGHQDTGGATR